MDRLLALWSSCRSRRAVGAALLLGSLLALLAGRRTLRGRRIPALFAGGRPLCGRIPALFAAWLLDRARRIGPALFHLPRLLNGARRIRPALLDLPRRFASTRLFDLSRRFAPTGLLDATRLLDFARPLDLRLRF